MHTNSMSRLACLSSLLCAVTSLRLPFARRQQPTTRVAVLGGGFAGLTAARTLAAHPRVEVLLIDQREYFEYTPGILRAWVEPGVHDQLVNPIRRLLRSPRAVFQRVPPGSATTLSEDGTAPKALQLSVADARSEVGASLVEHVWSLGLDPCRVRPMGCAGCRPACLTSCSLRVRTIDSRRFRAATT